MERENAWKLFEETGDPMAYILFKAAGEKKMDCVGRDDPGAPSDHNRPTI